MVKSALRPMHGVSLLEALVALAIMAFGMLGVVGMQSTLRTNSDVSKQRAEAVRIAQRHIEDWRAFAVLAPTASVADFSDITNIVSAPITGLTTNTSYALSATVLSPSVGRQFRTFSVRVDWADRNGQAQNVTMATAIAGIAPEIAGSLALAGDRAATQRPRGRHASIPIGAVEGPDAGTSRFTPPVPSGTSALSWIFDNHTGYITKRCTGSVCVTFNAQLLSGYINFATDLVQPSPAEAELPSGGSVTGLGVQVDLTLPSTSTENCFTQLAVGTPAIAYFCALPLTLTVPGIWSGSLQVTGLSMAPTMADFATANYKLCRYTPVRNHVPPGGNIDHPLVYTAVKAPLSNQNYLLIRAGNGSAPPFECPANDLLTPLIDGNTYQQQPSV